MSKINDDYGADSIVVLEGLDAVRKRPGMYIGSIGSKGMNHLVFEIVDNAVDEHLAGYCDKIFVTINADGSVTVEDNGRGIPVDINKKTGISGLEMVFTMLHAGGKFNNDNYKVAGGLHGVGASVVNALSKWLSVEVKRDGTIYSQDYKIGKPLYALKKKGKCDKSEHGSKITFLPDDSIFGKVDFKTDLIKNRLHETAYLNSGLQIFFKDNRKEAEEIVEFHEPEGIVGFVTKLNQEKVTKTPVIYFKSNLDKVEVECAIQFIDEFQENILGFCNNIYTQEGGTHITGYKSRFTSLINQYAREIGILKEKDDNFTGTDVRSGMTSVLAIKYPDPIFEGQTKTKLENPDAQRVVAEITGIELTKYFDKNLEVLKTVISCAEQSAKLHKAEAKIKTNMLSKPKFTIEGNGKLANCESKKPEECEVFIVEGKRVALTFLFQHNWGQHICVG